MSVKNSMVLCLGAHVQQQNQETLIFPPPCFTVMLIYKVSFFLLLLLPLISDLGSSVDATIFQFLQ